MKSSHWRIILLLPFLWTLVGCYIPYAYLTKIEIMNDGRYSLKFQGRVVAASFLNKIENENLQDDEDEYELNKVAHSNELVRLGFKNPQYVYPASYETSYEVKGNLFKERMVTFPSRSGSVLAIKLLKDNQIVVESRRMNEKYIAQLEKSGIPFVGNVALWTDIPVTKHNAHHVVPGTPADAYAWKIHSLSEKPIQLIGILGEKP